MKWFSEVACACTLLWKTDRQTGTHTTNVDERHLKAMIVTLCFILWLNSSNCRNILNIQIPHSLHLLTGSITDFCCCCCCCLSKSIALSSHYCVLGKGGFNWGRSISPSLWIEREGQKVVQTPPTMPPLFRNHQYLLFWKLNHLLLALSFYPQSLEPYFTFLSDSRPWLDTAACPTLSVKGHGWCVPKYLCSST